MEKELIIDDGEIINSTDWKAKAENIIERLDEELFAGLTEESSYDTTYDRFGNEKKTKKRVKKGEIMPGISAAQVTAKLNRFLRIYKPMSFKEACSLDEREYLEAYGYYLDIISHINKFTTFLGDKQTYSAFVNITSDVYNELLLDPKYSGVFASIEDGFVQSNFSVAQAGLVDGKTTITKLQTKAAGHNLVKNPESITIVQNNRIDKQLINEKLDKFLGMTKRLDNKK